MVKNNLEKRINADIIRSVILGHAVGDALGVPVEFSSRKELDRNPVKDMRSGGTYGQPAGTWSDDTSMTLCALAALSEEQPSMDAIMENFSKWLYHAEFTATDEVFDCGITCNEAVANYAKNHKEPLSCGLNYEKANGNGSLMRILPFALYAMATEKDANGKETWQMVSRGSRLTHGHFRSIVACRIYATVLQHLLWNPKKESVKEAIDFYRREDLSAKTEIGYFSRIDYDILMNMTRDEVRSTGYVVDSLEAALWCLLHTDSYRECVLLAVNLGDDTDTVAAIAGGLAGAFYGVDGIPEEWLKTLKKRREIETLCEKAAVVWERKRNDAFQLICDIHMHVVPGVDDGPDDIEESLQMLKASYEQGVRRIFCTSHSWRTLDERHAYDKAFSELKAAANTQIPDLELLSGCEIYADRDHLPMILKQLEDGILPTMNLSSYVLIEFHPDTDVSEMIDVVNGLRAKGYLPILAHAERYSLSSEEYSSLAAVGTRLSINLYSLSEETDSYIRCRAQELCQSGRLHFIGTDAHGMKHRPPKVSAGVGVLRESLKENYSSVLFTESDLIVPREGKLS